MHKKSPMRSVQVELFMQGFDSHSLISEKKKYPFHKAVEACNSRVYHLTTV